MNTTAPRPRVPFPVLALGLGVLAACAKEPDLVLYCSLDQGFSEPLILRFEKETGLDVRAEFDIEANKNVGLAMRIREEAQSRPRCDVFWSNECAQTVSMAEDGLLASYDSPSAREIPDTFRDPERRWTGFGARARVFIVNTTLADPAEIKSMWDLFDPRWRGKVAMARPLAGMTNTHMTALYLALGEAEGRRYVETAAKLAADGGLNLATGNAHVMRLVREGQVAFGWTDTDDYNVARLEGYPVAAVYPDRGGVGTLLVPNTVSILKSAPHPDAAKRFVDWVLRPEIEAELAQSRAAQIPVRASVPRPAHVVDATGFTAMKVDWRAVGESVQKRTAEFQELFLKVSRPLVVTALVAFAVLGLGPVVVMLARIAPHDLAGVFGQRSLALLGRTALLGGGAATVALVVGLPFGFLVARTDVPGVRVWRVLGVLPILLPPLVIAMSWAGMTSLRGGVATTLVLGFCTFPLVALYAARAFERIDARQEEAALLAGGLRGALRAELPLVMPSALFAACFAFVLAINDFAVPDYVSSIGPKWNVYADEVFASWRSDQNTGRAVAAALPLVLLTALALWPALELRRRNLLSSFASDFRGPSTLRLGAWRWPALAIVLAVLGVSALAPLGHLVYWSGGGSRGFSLEHMRAAFSYALELGRSNLQSSILFAAGAALIAVPIGLVVGHALERSGRAGRWLSALVLVPIAVPAILFGIGGIALWNRPLTGAVYDSGWMAVLLFAGRFLPFAVLAFSAAVAMLDPRIEESARLAGARPARRLFWIVTPAVLPAVFGAALLVFVLSMRELDASILVPAANSTVLFRLYNAVHFGRDDFVAALALLVVFFVVAPGLLWTFFARRRLEVLP